MIYEKTAQLHVVPCISTLFLNLLSLDLEFIAKMYLNLFKQIENRSSKFARNEVKLWSKGNLM